MQKQKTFALGIDGACWEYLNPLLGSGKLPNLSHLINTGSRGVLRSTIPPISSVAWSSFMTGKNPDNHGILDWCVKKENTNNFRPVFSFDRTGKGFWHYLSEKDFKVGVYNLPLTFPPEEINGFFISGFDSPADAARRTYPKGIYENLSKKYRDTFIKMPSRELPKHAPGHLLFTDLYIEHIDSQTQAALELIETMEIDFLAFNFMILDHLSHRVNDFSLVEKGIMAVDRNIGHFLKKYPDANYIIFSDHGSERIKHAFFIYNWLEQTGLIRFDQKKWHYGRLQSLVEDFLRNYAGLKGLPEKVVRNLLTRPAKLLPAAALRKLADSLSSDKRRTEYWPEHAVDIENSKILYCSVGCNGFYLNIKSESNPGGSIKSQEEYNRVLDKLSEGLLSLKAPDSDRPIFDKVFRREDIYSGIYKERSPDLIAHQVYPFFFCPHTVVQKNDELKSTLFSDSRFIDYYGAHTDWGICVFSGKDFKKGQDNISVDIKDLPAMFLYLNGVPIPDDFDGRVVKDVFTEEFLEQNRIDYKKYKEAEKKPGAEGMSKEDEEKIKKELVDLGYM